MKMAISGTVRHWSLESKLRDVTSIGQWSLTPTGSEAAFEEIGYKMPLYSASFDIIDVYMVARPVVRKPRPARTTYGRTAAVDKAMSQEQNKPTCCTTHDRQYIPTDKSNRRTNES